MDRNEGAGDAETALAWPLNMWGTNLAVSPNEAGEPNPQGVMRNTSWTKLQPTESSDIVVIGMAFEDSTALDSALAAYTGAAVDKLHLVAFKDDFNFTGIGATHSLIQFHAVKGTSYSIQLGVKNGSLGDETQLVIKPVSANGGLVAFLATVNGFRALPGDYECGFGAVNLPACTTATFVVYNSANKPMTVTGSQNLGAGIISPTTITVPARSARTMAFKFSSAFNHTTARTLSGFFKLQAKIEGKVVDSYRHRGAVVIKPPTSPPDVLRTTVTPSVQAGSINEPLTFRVLFANTGTETAVGCHVRSQQYQGLKTGFQRVIPSTSAAGPSLAPDGQVFTIAAKKSVNVVVTTLSQRSRIAVPAFAGPSVQPFVIDCANTQAAPITIANAFDITARGAYAPAHVALTKVTPVAVDLTVPPAGADYIVAARNSGPAAQIIATASYLHPSGDPAASQFKVKICRSNRAGGCISQLSASAAYSAAANSTAYLKVRVTPPANDPGFSRTDRRVLLVLNAVQPKGNIHDVPVAAASIAVKKN